MTMSSDPHDFDAAMRDIYHHAERTLPWQLQARLRAQPHTHTRRSAFHRPAWLTAAGATACALLLFVAVPQLRTPQPGDGLPSADLAVQGTPPADTAAPVHIDMLDVDPAFYAWLGSDDAQLMAME